MKNKYKGANRAQNEGAQHVDNQYVERGNQNQTNHNELNNLNDQELTEPTLGGLLNDLLADGEITAVRMPTEKELREFGVLVYTKRVSEDTLIEVYKGGYAVYLNGTALDPDNRREGFDVGKETDFDSEEWDFSSEEDDRIYVEDDLDSEEDFDSEGSLDSEEELDSDTDATGSGGNRRRGIVLRLDRIAKCVYKLKGGDKSDDAEPDDVELRDLESVDAESADVESVDMESGGIPYSSLPWSVAIEIAGCERKEFLRSVNDKKRTYLQLVDDYDRVSEEEYSSVCFLPDESREYSAEQEEKKEKLRIIKKALKSLTKRQRQVVEMYYGEGKTQMEIAKMTNVSHQMVSKFLKAAEKKLGRVGCKNGTPKLIK